ncbi:MAG: hypothetical protein D6729_05380 [Deltaproteobacteria bacterium]|nr:MAG: hypothetical protein D6729_05380 [Deltaproteobacteria bacterium]
MVKVCRDCKETYSGGSRCPACGAPLLDVADPAVRRSYLEDPDLVYSIRYLYNARRGMVLIFLGILLGIAVLFGCVQRGYFSEGLLRWAWYVGGGLVALALPLLGFLLGSRVVRSTPTQL